MSLQNQASNDMTVLTRQKYDLALSSLTLEDACRELRKNACMRTVSEVLLKAAGLSLSDTAALSDLLKREFALLTPGLSADAIRKKISSWLLSDTHSISKESAIQLAFLFTSDISEAENLIMLLCGERLHWRDPKELIFGFSLNTGHSYQEAVNLFYNLEEKGIFQTLDEDPDVFTESLEYDLLHINTSEELESYLFEHRKQLGKLHNTARSTASELLDFLKRPPDAGFLEVEDSSLSESGNARYLNQDRSVQEIVLENLYGCIIPRTKRASKGKKSEKLVLDSLQRSVREGWPDATTLSKMENKKLDVTRKTLILLFMASDGANTIYSDWHDATREDVFEDRLTRLNAMLIDCGYALIDPRLPFDWMVLFCLCDEENFINEEKMLQFLSAVFTGVK